MLRRDAEEEFEPQRRRERGGYTEKNYLCEFSVTSASPRFKFASVGCRLLAGDEGGVEDVFGGGHQFLAARVFDLPADEVAFQQLDVI